MANRYVRSTGGNSNAATTWESASGLKDTVLVPTSSDDIYLDAQSGQLTINAGLVCRSFDMTGYSNTCTHNSSLDIGTTTSRVDNVACILAGTYTSLTTSSITFKSTSVNVLTVDFNNKTVGNITQNSIGSYVWVNNFSCGGLRIEGGTLNTNGVIVTADNVWFACSNTTQLALGSSIFNLNGITTYNLQISGVSNLTIDANTATFNILGTSIYSWSPVNLNGASVYIKKTSNTPLYGSLTCANFGFMSAGTAQLTLNSGVTLTVTDNFYCHGGASGGLVTIGGTLGTSTITKTSGVVDIYQASISNIIFTGGATWNSRNNVTVGAGVTGLNQLGGVFYMDYLLGLNATTNTPYGWWSVSYTNATGTMPVEAELVIGDTSTSQAKITGLVNPYEWNTLHAGTLYFYGKSAPFVAETVSCANGGHFDITADFTYCAWKDITNGPTAARIAPGDEIRIAKSPDPTSLGQLATWTSTTTVGGGMEATKAISAMSNNGAGLIRLTVAAQTWVTDDVIQVMGLVTTGTTYEANGNWFVTVINTTTVDLQGSTYVNTRASGGTAQKINNKCVVLTNKVTQDICNCDVAWTPGLQTTSSLRDDTVFKEGQGSIKIITAATCNANQILAQFGLPAALDLNAGNYQQLSFWFRNETTAITSGQLEVRLYGETACTTLRDKFLIPAIPSTAYFACLTIDLLANIGSGSALGGGAAGTIQGIALYTTVQMNAKTFYIDNFIACKASNLADSITLQSLLSKNTLIQGTMLHADNGDEGWYGIQSIKDRIILLDNSTNAYGNYGKGYYSSTSDVESVTTYKRECIPTYGVTQTVSEAGTRASLEMKFEGGYSNVNNLQNYETFFDGVNGGAVGIASKSYSSYNYISVCRYVYGFDFYIGNLGSDHRIKTITNINNNSYAGIYGVRGPNLENVANINNNGPYGQYGHGISTAALKGYIGNIVNCNNNTQNGITIGGGAFILANNIKNLSNNGGSGLGNNNCGLLFAYGGGTCVGNIFTVESLAYNYHSGIMFDSAGSYNTVKFSNIFKNGSRGIYFLAGATENKVIGGTCTNNIFSTLYSKNYLKNILLTGSITSTGYNNIVFSQNHNNSLDNHYIANSGSLIVSDITNRHTASGIAWKMSPTSSDRDILLNPLTLDIAKVACKANTNTTVKVWVKKTSLTGIGAMLVVRGGQLNGMALTDYTNTAIASTDYQQLSVTFPSTETGVVNVEVWAYYVTSVSDSVYVDDFSATNGLSTKGLDIAYLGQPFATNPPSSSSAFASIG